MGVERVVPVRKGVGEIPSGGNPCRSTKEREWTVHQPLKRLFVSKIGKSHGKTTLEVVDSDLGFLLW